MTLYLSSEDVGSLCDERVAMTAARSVLAAQREGDFSLPSRLDIDTPHGFFRVMPAAVGGYAGMKVMTLAQGVGNRYLLALYSQASGDLLALLDADEVTRLRTAATTALAAELLCGAEHRRLGLIGTGFEATGHLRAFAHMWPLERVDVYSRSEEGRVRFADRMSSELGIEVVAAANAAEAVGHAPVSLLCTKSASPVVTGEEFAPGSVVLSIGSTRPDLRELGVEAFRRSAVLLVDEPEQVIAESGDVAAALKVGAIARDRIVAMHEWRPEMRSVDGDRDLMTFKSVGTALQDLVLAATLVTAATESGIGRELGELARLKPTIDVKV